LIVTARLVRAMTFPFSVTGWSEIRNPIKNIFPPSNDIAFNIECAASAMHLHLSL
jgi:hypothetical protein